jgi:hypothetical protein
MATEASTSAAVSGGGSWVEGMSADNIKGLVLALSSSFFIGASFIVKKKGLKKAGASGVRAGELIPFLTSFTSIDTLHCLVDPIGRAVCCCSSGLVFDTLCERAEGLEAGFPIVRGSPFPWNAAVRAPDLCLGLRLGGGSVCRKLVWLLQ